MFLGLYSHLSVGISWGFDITINQNTAPGGWNHVNRYRITNNSDKTYMFVTQSSPSAHTGADAAEIDYNQ